MYDNAAAAIPKFYYCDMKFPANQEFCSRSILWTETILHLYICMPSMWRKEKERHSIPLTSAVPPSFRHYFHPVVGLKPPSYVSSLLMPISFTMPLISQVKSFHPQRCSWSPLLTCSANYQQNDSNQVRN